MFANFEQRNFSGTEIREIPWIIAHGTKGKMANLVSSKVLDLNTQCDRASYELQNACFSFENDHSKLKLWALKDVLALV